MNASDSTGANPSESGGTPASREPAARPALPGNPPQPPRTKVLVAFSNPDEFLAELRDRGPNVDRVLRLTFRWHTDASGAPVTDLWVVANYLRRLDPGALAVVRLEHHAGGVWWSGINDAASEESRRRAEDLRQRIDAAARALGIEVRAGTYRPSPPAEEAR